MHMHTRVQTGAVSRLATFFERHDDHKLQSEAANALANISAGTSENTCAVIEAGVVLFMLSLCQAAVYILLLANVLHDMHLIHGLPVFQYSSMLAWVR